VKHSENTRQHPPMDQPLSGLAIALGCLGVLPFLVCAIAMHFAYNANAMFSVFSNYAAVILSFLGGIRWAFAVNGQLQKIDLVLAVMPSLLAWCSLLMPPTLTMTGFILGFIAMAYLDVFARPLPLTRGFLRLRLWITLCVLGLHFLVLSLVWQ
jgi:Protein of unknown function (DUF3429)